MSAIVSYIVLATSSTFAMLVLAFALFGIYSAATDGVERALAAKLIGHELLGAGEGTLQAAVGLSSLFAGSIGGLLWVNFGHVVALSYVSAVSIIGLSFLLLINRRHRI